MKKTIISLTALALSCSYVLGQTKDKAKAERAQIIQAISGHIDEVYHLGVHLSNHIAIQNSDQHVNAKEKKHITGDIQKMDSLLSFFEPDRKKMSPVFNATEKATMAEQIEGLRIRDSLMKESILLLVDGPTAPRAAQIDYTSNRINSFITTVSNFKQYFQSLTPLIPDTLYEKINTIINAMERHTDGNQYLMASAYSHNVYGLTYLHRIGPISASKTISYLGAEIIGPAGVTTVNTPEYSTERVTGKIPTNAFVDTLLVALSPPTRSTYAKNPGAYIVYGLRDSKLLFQMAVGYFKTALSEEDISWKCSVLYTPRNWGIGLSYSPLTSAGVQVAYKW